MGHRNLEMVLGFNNFIAHMFHVLLRWLCFPLIKQAARVFESQLAESILEGDGQLAFKKLATATLETLMPRIEGKGEFGHARWRLVYAPQIPSLLSVDPTVDPLKSLASNISFGTEVEVQLGKRLQVIFS